MMTRDGLAEDLEIPYKMDRALCVYCGGPDALGGARGDPETVIWYCIDGSGQHDCQNDKASTDLKRRTPHEGCGYRVMLPLPEAKS